MSRNAPHQAPHQAAKLCHPWRGAEQQLQGCEQSCAELRVQQLGRLLAVSLKLAVPPCHPWGNHPTQHAANNPTRSVMCQQQCQHSVFPVTCNTCSGLQCSCLLLQHPNSGCAASHLGRPCKHSVPGFFRRPRNTQCTCNVNRFVPAVEAQIPACTPCCSCTLLVAASCVLAAAGGGRCLSGVRGDAGCCGLFRVGIEVAACLCHHAKAPIIPISVTAGVAALARHDAPRSCMTAVSSTHGGGTHQKSLTLAVC